MELYTAILPSRCSFPPTFSTPTPHLRFARPRSLPLKNSVSFSRFNFLTKCKAESALEPCEAVDESRMNRVCDKLIGVFMVDKPTPTDWRRLLAFSREWDSIRPHFFTRCHEKADSENDPAMKEKLLRLARKLKQVVFYLCQKKRGYQGISKRS